MSEMTTTEIRKYIVRQTDGYAMPADQCMFSQMGSGVRFVHIPEHKFYTDSEFKVVYSEKNYDDKLAHPATMARLRAEAKKTGVELNTVWQVQQ